MTGIAAAAVISLCVILWPKEETPESMTTAEVVVSEQNRETLKQDMLAENVAEKQETPTKKVAERPVRKAEPAVTHEVTAETRRQLMISLVTTGFRPIFPKTGMRKLSMLPLTVRKRASLLTMNT